MSFLFLISGAGVVAWLMARMAGMRPDLRTVMRWGMGLGFVLTGVDHFVSAQVRYVPMIPYFMSELALFWVYFTGAAELAGGIAFLMPVSLINRLGVAALHKLAGAGLALLLACVVIANIHVAQQGEQVQGLPFGTWYYWLRPLFQPIFIVWALYCSGLWRGPAVTAPAGMHPVGRQTPR